MKQGQRMNQLTVLAIVWVSFQPEVLVSSLDPDNQLKHLVLSGSVRTQGFSRPSGLSP